MPEWYIVPTIYSWYSSIIPVYMVYDVRMCSVIMMERWNDDVHHHHKYENLKTRHIKINGEGTQLAIFDQCNVCNAHDEHGNFYLVR